MLPDYLQCDESPWTTAGKRRLLPFFYSTPRYFDRIRFPQVFNYVTIVDPRSLINFPSRVLFYTSIKYISFISLYVFVLLCLRCCTHSRYD